MTHSVDCFFGLRHAKIKAWCDGKDSMDGGNEERCSTNICFICHEVEKRYRRECQLENEGEKLFQFEGDDSKRNMKPQRNCESILLKPTGRPMG